MTRKFIITISIITIITASPTIAAGEEILRLNDFIETSIKSNPRYQISVEEYLVALYDNMGAKSIEDWNLIASATYFDSYPNPTNYSASYLNTLGYSIGVEKYFPATGTSVNLEHSNTRASGDYVTIPGFPTFPSPSYVADISLTITQPLLKNAFGLLTKKSLEMSDHSFALAKIKLAEDWEDFISYLIGEYREWQRCHTNVKVYENKLARVENQLSLVERQKEVGLSEELELVQIQQKAKGYRALLEQAKMNCETQAKKIVRIMGEERRNISSLTPEEYEKSGEVLSEEEAMEYIGTDSNVKNTTDLLVLLQQTNLEMKENETLPDLMLMLQARPNSYSESAGDSFTEIGEHRDYTVSISASRGLFNDLPDAQKKKAVEELEKSMKEREQTLLELKMGLEELYTSLKHLNIMLDLNNENLELAEKRLDLEKKKFDQGRNTIFFVLQAEDDLLAAENTLYETLFARESVVNQIKSITDTYTKQYKQVLIAGEK